MSLPELPPESDVNPTLSEIVALLDQFPQPDSKAQAEVDAHWRSRAMPRGALGSIADLVRWALSWRSRLERVRVAVFMGRHGVVSAGVTPYPAHVDDHILENIKSGKSAIAVIARAMGADLRVYELDREHPTQDFRFEPAMSDAECARAMAYGMMAVDDAVDVLVLGEVGLGNTTSASALALALWRGNASDWVGRGSGSDDQMVRRKIQVVTQAVERHRLLVANNPWKALRTFGGRETAALVGALIAARMARVPVLLDGFHVGVAASVLARAAGSDAVAHCWAAHQSAEPGHQLVLEQMGLSPLALWRLSLGEGAGAAMTVETLRMGVRLFENMAPLLHPDD